MHVTLAVPSEEERKQTKRGARGGGVLSFDFDGDDEEEERGGGGGKEVDKEKAEGTTLLQFYEQVLTPIRLSLLHPSLDSPPSFKKKKMTKNPTVDTSFLPDKEREVSVAPPPTNP